MRVPTAKPLLLIWDELECIRSLVSITVRLAQPSPFVRKSKSRDQEKKASPPYHCQVMTLFWRVLSSSLVKRDIWRLRWFIGYFYGVTKTWKDQAGSKCIYIYILEGHEGCLLVTRMHQFLLFFSCLFLLLKGHILVLASDLCVYY